LKAPLLIGADLRNIRRESLELLKTPGVLAINQDAMGVAGDLIVTHGSQQVSSRPAANEALLASHCMQSSSTFILECMQIFAGPLSGGRRAAALVNKHPLGSPVSMTLMWSKIGYPDSLQVQVQDAFTGNVLRAAAQSNITLQVPPDDIIMVTLKPLPEQICSFQEHLGVVESVQVLDQGNKVQPADGLRVEQTADEKCVRLSALNIWRPWHHGFFNLGVENVS
jgi:Alpha galactosidase C-terminal beta sandwich domain